MKEISNTFNMFRRSEDLELEEDLCPKCKKFRLVREYGYEWCSNGNCSYKKVISSEKDESFYDGII